MVSISTKIILFPLVDDSPTPKPEYTLERDALHQDYSFTDCHL